MLRQQNLQVLRLCHGPRKTVEHEAVPAIRLLDAIRDHLEHQRIRHKLPARHDGLGLLSQRRAIGDILAQHVARGEMRNAAFLGELLALSALAGARRTEEDHRAIQRLDGLHVRAAQYRFHYRRPRNRPFFANPS